MESSRRPVGKETDTNRTEQREFIAKVRIWRGVVAGFAALVVVVLWALMIRTRSGQIIDTLTMDSTQAHVPVPDFAHPALTVLLSVPVLVVVGLTVAAFALYRHRAGLIIRLVFVFGAANATTQGIKSWVDRPVLDVGFTLDNSFPSGHVTALAALAVVLMVVVPLRMRRVVAVFGLLLTAWTGITVMSMGWHRLSDVVGAIMIVAFFSMVGLPSEWVPDKSRRNSLILAGISLIGMAVATVGLAVVTTRLPVTPSGWVVALEILSWGAQMNPGAIVAAFGALMVVSASGLMVAAVGRLAGS